MGSPTLRTLRYVRSWITGRADVRARELVLDRDGTPVPATLVTPAAPSGPLPAWIVLHGITRPGRAHRGLVRFVHALAEGGVAVLVPEVPEWRELDPAPRLTTPSVLAGVRALEGLGGLVAAGRVGLVGFSFGAPQALLTSAHPALRGRLAGVVGFGGYADLERTLVFQFSGRHEWKGDRYLLRPDPYGRWIVGANYLTSVSGCEDAGEVAGGLRRLAAAAGDVGVVAWDARFDADKGAIRATLAPRWRALFDLFAPPSHQEPDRERAEEMARLLAAAVRLREPTLEPASFLQDVPGPVHLLHGRQDRLIPFTEMLRLADALRSGVLARGTVTRLFAHSTRDALPGWRESAREAAAFVKALSGMIELV
ncbi:MAG: dienelactone hydrolase family protein [Longimicrobiales bacterium]